MASTTAKGKYPEQLIAMVSTETKSFIRDKAAETDRSISEVARDYLEAGITATEEQDPELDHLKAEGELTPVAHRTFY